MCSEINLNWLRQPASLPASCCSHEVIDLPKTATILSSDLNGRRVFRSIPRHFLFFTISDSHLLLRNHHYFSSHINVFTCWTDRWKQQSITKCCPSTLRALQRRKSRKKKIIQKWFSSSAARWNQKRRKRKKKTERRNWNSRETRNWMPTTSSTATELACDCVIVCLVCRPVVIHKTRNFSLHFWFSIYATYESTFFFGPSTDYLSVSVSSSHSVRQRVIVPKMA